MHFSELEQGHPDFCPQAEDLQLEMFHFRDLILSICLPLPPHWDEIHFTFWRPPPHLSYQILLHPGPHLALIFDLHPPLVHRGTTAHL